ncbi:hypothetical protein [Tautonia marina]|uniref:hypothetical protein n=1 Tax=Tautonia marina TaxID=2653855 RepID=UPI001260FCAF|nr:hypothetical protein [Tautonia marina]
MMRTLVLILVASNFAGTITAQELHEDRVADQVVFRDGSRVLGQVLPDRAARVSLIVRRAWVEEHLPDRASSWDDQDRATRQRAQADRVRRLREWRQERQQPAAPADPIAAWIDAELSRLNHPEAQDRLPLMVVSIPRSEVLRIDLQPEHRRRMLRQGWRAGFDQVETMPEGQLRAGLQDRGFALGPIDTAPIDDLLPVPVEGERRWLARRASTEALTDPDLRFIRFGDLVLPDPSSDGALDPTQMAGTVGSLLGNLLGNGPRIDPMKPHLDRIAESGRIGVVVTVLETSPDFDRVAVEAILLIRTAPGRWETGTRRRVENRPADLPAHAGQQLANDPQVRAAVQMLQGLGLGRVDPQAQQLSLAVGAATQRALEQARSALEADLRSVALRMDRGPIGPVQ